jgi:hypothetical protein
VVTFSEPAGIVVGRTVGEIGAGKIVRVGVCSVVNVVTGTVVFWLSAETDTTIRAHIRRNISNARFFFI